MITTLVLVIHVIVCMALILIILLQTGKGADIGAAFGGGSSQTVFGSGGATTFLSKVTVGAAVLFMITSIVLTYFSDRGAGVRERSIVSERSTTEAVPTAPAQPPSADSAQGDGGGKPAQPAAAGPVEKPAAAPNQGGGEAGKQ